MTNDKELTHIDLFSGIGGFTLAAEWAGFKTVVFCEKEKFCQKILKKRFGAIAHTDNGRQPRNIREAIPRRENKAIPDSKLGSRNSRGSGIFRPLLIPEIRDFDGTKYRGATLLTGGFPCQPFSVAGQRRGKEDDRYLWPEMLRVINEAKPRWILAENVPGIFRMALDTVLADLEGEGYTTGTFIIPACGLNAPHRRNRIWIIANSRRQYGEGSKNKRKLERQIFEKKNASLLKRSAEDDRSGNDSDSESRRIQGRPISIRQRRSRKATCNIERIRQNAANSKSANSRQSKTKNRRQDSGGRNIEIDANSTSSRLERAFGQVKQGHSGRFASQSRGQNWQEDWYEIAARFCRVDDGISDRIHRLKALGNAIVPQIAYEILKNIAWIENNRVV